MSQNAHKAAAFIQQAHPHFQPKIGLILGSGLGDFANQLTQPTTIDYANLPGFPEVSVSGHQGQLVLGALNDTPVVCLKGRAHSYEGDNHETVKTYVRTLHLLGCEYLIVTNASGSLHANMPPGELMLITDHLNFQSSNPLVGSNDDQFGPRFYPLDEAYHPTCRQYLIDAAKKNNVDLHQGVYVCVMGPNYETAAEIRAFRTLGGDAVGMSTVPEVLVANHCGMKVAAIATITNYATGLATESHDHNAVLQQAQQATEKLSKLLTTAIAQFA